MSEKEATDSKEKPAKAKSFEKLTLILVGVALVATLTNTALIVMNPTAKKVEQFNEELKTELAESVATLHKKIDGLRSAEVEWQSVLKKSPGQSRRHLQGRQHQGRLSFCIFSRLKAIEYK